MGGESDALVLVDLQVFDVSIRGLRDMVLSFRSVEILTVIDSRALPGALGCLTPPPWTDPIYLTDLLPRANASSC